MPAAEITQAAAVDVPPVQGAGGRRHHRGADGGRADLPLRHGRGRGRPRHRPRRRCRDSSPRARSRAGCTAPTGSAATRCPTCWCSAAAPVPVPRPTSTGSARCRRSSEQSIATAREDVERPIHNSGGENAYTVHQELQQTMNDLVGIIRKADEMELALKKLARAQGPRSRASRSTAAGPTTRDGTSRSTCATCSWSASASPRRRSSGRRAVAVTPATTTRRWTRTGARSCSSCCAAAGRSRCTSSTRASRTCAPDLFDLFELDELKKYYTGDELGGHRSDAPPRQSRGTEDAGGDPGGELTGGGA